MSTFRSATVSGTCSRTGAKFRIARTPEPTTRSTTACAASAGTATIDDLDPLRREHLLQLGVRANPQLAPLRPDLLLVGIEHGPDVEPAPLEVAVAEERRADLSRPDQRHPPALVQAQDLLERPQQLHHRVAEPPLPEGAERPRNPSAPAPKSCHRAAPAPRSRSSPHPARALPAGTAGRARADGPSTRRSCPSPPRVARSSSSSGIQRSERRALHAPL
jgi:hypothetical protein